MKQTCALVAICLGLTISLSGDGFAQARPDLRNMTCAQARDIVYQYGAVVMTTGQHTFKRFVIGQGFCFYPYVARGAWVATKDSPSCRIGFTCEQRLDLFDW